MDDKIRRIKITDIAASHDKQKPSDDFWIINAGIKITASSRVSDYALKAAPTYEDIYIHTKIRVLDTIYGELLDDAMRIRELVAMSAPAIAADFHKDEIYRMLNELIEKLRGV